MRLRHWWATLGVLAPILVAVTSSGIASSAAPVRSDPFAVLQINHVPPGTPATFELRALSGDTVQAQDLRGKVVLLNFWATWCGPCKDEMPSLARLQQRLDLSRYRVVTVTADVYPQGIKQFLTQLGIGLPVLFDEDQEVSRAFLVRGLPTTVVLAADGRAVGRAVGPRAWDSPEAMAVLEQVYERAP